VLTRVAHWELAGLVTAGALAWWLRTPTLPVALAACAAGIAAVALAVRPRPLAALLAGAIVLVGVTRILQTSLQVGQVERSWDADGGVRWRLVAAAGARLDRELSSAVTTVRGLAETGVRAAGTGRDAAFASLDAAVRGGGPERGVVVLEPTGRPWAWAGRHRMPASRGATRDSARLEVRITPFYAVLSAGRQGPGGREVVAHVLLAADSVVPDAGRGLGAQFARATGVRLEVFPPGGGPQLDDVFDYCVPGCRAVGVVPDTLFSVRLAPPAQGAYRAGLLSRGGAWGATATVLLFVTFVVLGGPWTRVLAVAGLALTMLLTPAGTRLPLGRLFSSAVYYADLLGPLAASSGALFVTAALATMAAVVLLNARGTRRPALAAAVVLVGAAPFVLLRLASGITPPTEGADAALWLTWQAGLAAAGLALLLLAAALARLGGAPAGGRWGRAAALLLAPIVAAAGLATWAPSTGWPVWYLVAWVVPFALAVLPQPRLVTVVLVGLAAGANAVVLVWGAAADGRVLQADRDAAGIRQGSDPIALGLLERFGATLERGPPPRNAAQLYRQWQRSPLESDRYPAVLSLWDFRGLRAGAPAARGADRAHPQRRPDRRAGGRRARGRRGGGHQPGARPALRHGGANRRPTGRDRGPRPADPAHPAGARRPVPPRGAGARATVHAHAGTTARRRGEPTGHGRTAVAPGRPLGPCRSAGGDRQRAPAARGGRAARPGGQPPRARHAGRRD
jgi:hypothetical protein